MGQPWLRGTPATAGAYDSRLTSTSRRAPEGATALTAGRFETRPSRLGISEARLDLSAARREHVGGNERSAVMDLPKVVSAEEWEAANKRILAKEKEMTRQSDALAAERRRQPIMRVEKKYEFEGSNGKATLLDLFEGRRQLFVYSFMFGPNQEVGCDGCSMVVGQLTHLTHLHARNTSFALASRAPIGELERYRKRMGWDVPWYSWGSSNYGVDLGLSPAEPNRGEDQD